MRECLGNGINLEDSVVGRWNTEFDVRQSKRLREDNLVQLVDEVAAYYIPDMHAERSNQGH